MPYDSTLSRVYACYGLYCQYGVGLGRVLDCAVVKVLHYSRRYSVPRFTARGGVQRFLWLSDYNRRVRPAVGPGRWAGALSSTPKVYITTRRNVNPFSKIFLNIFSCTNEPRACAYNARKKREDTRESGSVDLMYFDYESMGGSICDVRYILHI